MNFGVIYFLFSFVLYGIFSLLYFGISVNSKYEDVLEEIWKLSIINWLISLVVFAISILI